MTIQCPNREAAGAQRDNGDQVLQAIKFTDKKVPELHLGWRFPNCWLLHGSHSFFSSSMADVALRLGPYMSISNKNVICTRTEKARKCRQITTNHPSQKSFMATKWGGGAGCHTRPSASRSDQSHAWRHYPISHRQTWLRKSRSRPRRCARWTGLPTTLRLWHMTKDLHQFVDQESKWTTACVLSLENQPWKVCEQSALLVAGSLCSRNRLQQNVRKKPPKADIDEFKAKWSFNGSPLLKSQEPCLVRPRE